MLANLPPFKSVGRVKDTFTPRNCNYFNNTIVLHTRFRMADRFVIFGSGFGNTVGVLAGLPHGTANTR